MHCSVRFLLCEVFNYTFPLLTMHVLVLELYPATPRHCPGKFCLLRLWCTLTWKPASASMPSRKSSCACRSCARWFHRSCFVVPNAGSTRRDLIITSNTVVLSRRLATLFTYWVSSWNYYKVQIILNCYTCSAWPSSDYSCSYQRC